MKLPVDFNQILLTPRGEFMTMGEDPQPFRLGDALCPALLGTWTGDQRDLQSKLRDARLGWKIMRENEYTGIELGDEERKHLLEVTFATVPAAHLVAQISAALGFTEEEGY